MTDDGNPFTKAQKLVENIYGKVGAGASNQKPIALEAPTPAAAPAASFHPQWKHASTFTIRQAAYLWGGHEPQDGLASVFDRNQPADFAATLQMLRGAVHRGKIKRVHQKYMYTATAHEEDEISREDLKAFADEIGQLPAFLFDTAIQQIETGDDKLSKKPLAPDALGPTYGGKDGGRPPDYHWNRVAGLAAFIEGDAGLEGSNAAMTDAVLSAMEEDPSLYTVRGDSSLPDKSTIQRHLAPLFNEIRFLKDRNNEKKLKESKGMQK